MKAEIISIGTELLLGEIVDTNTPFLADQLALLGIDLYFSSAVGDNYERLTGVFKRAWQRSDIIICTGGLGPTQDDLTREAIAGLVGETAVVDPELEEELVKYFTLRGAKMARNNVKQATVIPSSKVLKNPRGTAPGWWVEKEGHIIIAMPGPPSEMHFMWRNQVLPMLQHKTETVILSRTLKTFGIGESQAEEMVSHLVSSANPTLATYAKPDGVYLRIAAKAAQSDVAQDMISKMEADVRTILNEYIWGADDDTQESVTANMLIEKGLSLAFADSFSGGILAHDLSKEPRAESYFKGALVTASKAAKVALGIESALLDEGDQGKIATALASLVRRTFSADIGIGIEGYTESSEGSLTDKVFIAIECENPVLHTVQIHTRRHPQMKTRAGHYAISDLRKLLSSL
jgi:nicotinamide-nucleotide amidase